MDDRMKKMIEEMKIDMINQSEGAKKANAIVPVSGERYVLPLENRNIGMVYYSCGKRQAPLILGFHGGGFLFGGAALDDAMWQSVSDELEADIASIDYRMTPEYRYPSPIEDAYDAAVYLRFHADEYGFDPAHISVMGCSAGGNISAAVSIMAKEKGGVHFDYQILLYPYLDMATDPAVKARSGLPDAMMYVFNELYVDSDRTREPYCSPVYTEDSQLRGLPKAIVCLAENDGLNQEGRSYAERLIRCGNTVFVTETEKGIPHGYFEYGFGNAAGQDFLDETVKAKISDGTIARNVQKSLAFIKKHWKF